MAASFIEKHRSTWRQLEELLNRVRGFRRLRNLSRNQVRQLGNSYRRTVADLAIACVESRDQRLVSYLNNLVIRAHSLIYYNKGNGLRFIWTFYRTDFPSIFRQTYRYPLTVLILFAVTALFAFIATWHDDDFAEFAYLPSPAIQDIKEGHKWWDSLNKTAPTGAVIIIFNNIGVAVRIFALSLFPVVGTLHAIMPTSLQFGAINALAIKYQMKLKLWSFVAGHGILEFVAIFIAGGAGLLLGLSLLLPGEYTRRDALLIKGSIAVQLLVGCIPLLILAGLIESFISPNSIHYYFKLAISLGSFVGLLLYLLSERN
jgi:uncharacterized membrane protein SpoIIM required for sporulation